MAVKRRRIGKKRAARPANKRKAAGRKKPAKRSGKRRAAAKAKVAKPKEASLEKVAEVTHYFPHVKAAAALVLKDGLKVGDNIYIKGHTTNFKQAITSMQLDHVPIQEAKKTQEIGILVKSRVRIGDTVYRI
jgi:putative protease